MNNIWLMGKNVVDQLQKITQRLLSFRREIVGTLSLIGVLILVYQGEVLLADHFGYANPMEMFANQSVLQKRLLAALAGPFLHQGSGHIIGNLGLFLLLGIYIEHAYSERVLVTFFLISGYISIWATLGLGFVGAVGASGVTFGLQAWMGIHAFSRFIEYLVDLASYAIHSIKDAVDVPDNPGAVTHRRLLYAPFFLFGFGSPVDVLSAVVNGQANGATEISHAVGALVGLSWGLIYLGHADMTEFVDSISQLAWRVLDPVVRRIR